VTHPGKAPDSSDQPVRLTGADAFRLHLTLAAGLALCIGAFCFELIRALGGHTFSWMYVFEWPLFAGFAIYMWWNLLNGLDRQPRQTSSGNLRPPADKEGAGHEDLEAWHRYLLEMEATEHKEQGESN
jgi:hypothetical protein